MSKRTRIKKEYQGNEDRDILYECGRNKMFRFDTVKSVMWDPADNRVGCLYAAAVASKFERRLLVQLVGCIIMRDPGETNGSADAQKKIKCRAHLEGNGQKKKNSESAIKLENCSITCVCQKTKCEEMSLWSREPWVQIFTNALKLRPGETVVPDTWH